MNDEIINCVIRICNFPTIYKTENLSPYEIIKQSGYFKFHSIIDLKLIEEYLENKNEIIESWIQYSEDIRHSPAWGFSQRNDGKWIVFYLGGFLKRKFVYSDKFKSCAKMIKKTVENIRNS